MCLQAGNHHNRALERSGGVFCQYRSGNDRGRQQQLSGLYGSRLCLFFFSYSEASCFGVCKQGAVYRRPTQQEITASNGEVKSTWWACDAEPPGKTAWFVTTNDATKDQYASSCPGMGIENGGYFGRGPKQLTYAGNYGWAGKTLYPATPDIFLNDPNKIIADPVIGWEAGLAYQLVSYTEQGTTYTKPTMTQAVNQQAFTGLNYNNDVGDWGFGQTINVINGGVECVTNVESDDTRVKQLGRFNNYIELMVRFGVDIKGVTVTNQIPADAKLATNAADPKNYSVDDLKYNIYLRRTKTSGDWGEVLWMTAPLADLFNDKKSVPWGPYYLYYNDPEETREVPAASKLTPPESKFTSAANIAERVDCWGYTPYNKATKKAATQ
ncbi:hypothetical protein F6R98_15565 [Candidatus Methylospira mobilis]|uniref:Glycoside hydrolase family 19 catalytic domain-containing protein n=1 Tax=Candidatus Methylospira mobilis TaxID=1808979 RepID=A0A5Q0BNP9_9GAMM|nr:hypothetical protein F6R98_15565 [Candidatus Methylospira mobilis]